MKTERVTASRIDDNLRGVDALCDRWANEAWDWAAGKSHPIWRAMREREGAPLPSGEAVMSNEVLALDGILAAAEGRYRVFVVEWYIRGGSVAQKAAKLGVSRTELYGLWRRTLEYLRGRLHSEGVPI